MKVVSIDARVLENGNTIEAHGIEIPLYESAITGEFPWELTAARVKTVGEEMLSAMEGTPLRRAEWGRAFAALGERLGERAKIAAMPEFDT